MGRVVPDWLDSLDIAHWTLTADGPGLAELLRQAQPVLQDGRPAFVLVGKEAIANDAPMDAVDPPALPTRDEVVAAVAAEVGDAYLLSTTGYLSRSLYNLGDREQNFYMQGSMGHVGSLALGAALGRPDSRFVVLDGDGALLMHLGALATIGNAAPANLTHVVFDNGVYDSTGGQLTGCNQADFAAVALACGYRDATSVDSVDALRSTLRAALATAGPSLLVVRGAPGGAAGKRASNTMSLQEISDRFRDGLAARNATAAGRRPA
jgi:phosphonopyruvate decarboxylase